MIGDHPMRKPEHRIIEEDIMSAILDSVEFVTVGTNDGDYPYMVPVNFGYEFADDKLLIYVHGAREGHKADLWRGSGKVTCVFTMFQNHPHINYNGGIHDYRCIMANGRIREIDPHEEAGLWGRGFQLILKHTHRRPNEFRVPHYMFMTEFVIECDMKNVTAKSEHPVYSAEDVAFPTLQELIFEGDKNNGRSDFERLVQKPYGSCPKGSSPVPITGPLLPVLIEDDAVTVNAFWNAPADGSFDADLYAFTRTADAVIKRRYNLASYQQPVCIDKAIKHLGDDITAFTGCEGLDIVFSRLPEDITEILLVIAVYRAGERGQDLGDMGYVSFVVQDTDFCIPIAGGCVDVKGSGSPAAVYASFSRTEGGWVFSPCSALLDKWDVRSCALSLGLKQWKE